LLTPRLQISPSFHASAGSSLCYDVATAGERIAPSSMEDFAAVPVDTYDLHAQDRDNRTVDLRTEISSFGDYDWVITTSHTGQTLDLVLQNNSSSEICTVYISRRDVGYTDFEVAISISPGASQTIDPDVGPYDLWAADCGGHEFGMDLGVDLLSCGTWVVSDNRGELLPGFE
jgi:hypothetical protein